MNVAAPLISANSSSTQSVRTLISCAYTRYRRVREAGAGGHSPAILPSLFDGASRAIGIAGGEDSTLREYSRTRYEPGVHTGIIKSTVGWPSVGIEASTST
jgi:hypothetical protein